MSKTRRDKEFPSGDTTYAFVAFASSPQALFATIESAISKANSSSRVTEFVGWPSNDIPGRPISHPIQSGISAAPFVVADISTLNLNVTYEIGYAIGIGKRVYLVKDDSYTHDPDVTQKVGIFDTLGYKKYENSDALANTLISVNDFTPLDVSRPLDTNAPVYIVEPPQKGDDMIHIVSCIKRSRLQFRSFNPSEDSRLAASDAIDHVSSAHGVIIPFLSDDVRDSFTHNIRAAFVAGLAHGMHKPALLLKPRGFEAPLDLRDETKEYTRLEDIRPHINQLALDVVESIQNIEPIVTPDDRSLARFTIGDPMAENEFQTLGKYYLRREEFNRTVRGEVNLVVGRKGSGKTALFSQIRNHLRRDPSVIVLDLKPEGYQLVKLREQVFDFLKAGAKEHLITLFWEYLLLREVAHKLLQKDRRRYLRDHLIYSHYQTLRETYNESPHLADGDFSERLASLSESVADAFQKHRTDASTQHLSTDDVTEIIRSGNLPKLKTSISDYLAHKNGVWILFDNLDKGWTIPGPSETDILILRCLIDGARKCQREMQADGHDFHSIVFVRNDVYELLINESADFGKEMRASLDWSNPDTLREMLRLRLIQNGYEENEQFDKIWNTICVSHINSEETSQFLIDRCLMRPRNLLKLFSHCKASASNMQHNMILENDIVNGLKNYSSDLVMEADQELTNIELGAADLIYYFIGEDYVFSLEELEIIFDEHSIPNEKYAPLVRFLLYFGFFGVKIGAKDTTYIYDVDYDLKRLEVPISKAGSSVRYVLNPALWPALGVGPDV